MADLDRAVPVTRAPREPGRRRFRIPGWSMLIVMVAGVVAFAYYSSREANPVEPVDILTYACEQEVEEDQPWQHYLDAGCREAATETTITLMHLAGELAPGTRTGATTHFDSVAVKSIELALRVQTAEPRQALVLFDASTETPAHLRDLNHDRARQTWTGPFRPDGGTQFVLVQGPVIEVP